jgi:hypothetical protein
LKPINLFFDQIAISNGWKQYLNQQIGGFNSAKHAVYIETAINNAKKNFSEKEDIPDLACTSVFLLAEKILPLVKSEVDDALVRMTSPNIP